jgi:hypothetical protein
MNVIFQELGSRYDVPMYDQYLIELTNRCKDVLGRSLMGLYLQGSGAQGDYRQGKSDIDIAGVVSRPLSDQEKENLCVRMEHSSLSVPAAGLDFLVFTQSAAQNPIASPPHELWFSTGETWKTSVEKHGDTTEHLIVFATCRERSRALLGPEAKELFAPVPRHLLLTALIDVLNWHQGRILDPFHDPGGQYSVLNACRAWQYAKEGQLSSKTDGALWVLSKEPQNTLVRDALALRRGERSQPLNATEIQRFLGRVTKTLNGQSADCCLDGTPQGSITL